MAASRVAPVEVRPVNAAISGQRWNAEAIAHRLEKHKATPTGWKACCPAHEDKNPSLFMADGSDGKGVALVCYAGCSYKSIAEALNARGIEVGIVTDMDGIPTEHFQLGPYHAHWDYRNPSGQIIMRVCRWEKTGGKDIRPLVREDGRWKWAGHPTPRPLFNLDRLAANPDLPVLVVEGEKAAIAAQGVFPGYVVTTWPGGAASYSSADWPPLYGRTVDIWPDADEPGRKAGVAICLSLVPNCLKVRLVTPAGVSDGWDAADAVADGWDQVRIQAWVNAHAKDVVGRPTIVPRETKPAVPPPEPQAPAVVAAEHEGGPLPAHLLILGTDMHAVRRFTERHGNDVRYAREASWLVWDGQRWRIDEKAVMVANLAKESAEAMYDEIRRIGADKRDEAYKTAKLYLQKRAVESVIWLARSETGVPVELITFDADPWILNAQNGIINLRTGELLPHDRAARCTMIAGTEYLAEAEAPRWSQFIGEICLQNTELMDYLQRMCGYLLTADTGEQCLFFLHGGGSNGKTTFVETIMRVMGQYATAGEPDLLMTRKNQGIPADVAKLRGARAVFLNETNQGHRFDEAKLKNLTGGDTLEARFMRENFFTFRPTHKLVLRGNHKPTVTGTDEGIWRRLRLIPFDLRLTDAERDRSLEATLARELPGILAWMVQGCLMWQQGGLKTPAVISEAIKEYRDESDTMARFLDDRCNIRPNSQVKAGALYKAYREFCDESHERALSAKDFPVELEHRDPCIKRKKSNGVRLIEGIELAGVDNWASRYPG